MIKPTSAQTTSPGILDEGVTIVTGTDTDVGKTVATAWLTSRLLQRGMDVAVSKPAQTGLTPTEPGDLARVCALSGLHPDRTAEYARLAHPLAPTTAARLAGVPLPSVADHAARLADLASQHQTVLVEGAGGILVGLDDAGLGLLELADCLTALGHRPRFVVVTRIGLGTLNHTELTCRAIRAAGHDLAGLIIGSLPGSPGLAERCNLDDLPAHTRLPLLAALPTGIGSQPDRLRALAKEPA